MPELIPYDRRAAVRYAHRWAYGRNPNYFDFETIGGDCTNFASQCLYQGSGVMNFTPDLGWYYIDGGDKAPAWTGVPYFYNFMTRPEETRGPVGVAASLEMLEPGDFWWEFFEHVWIRILPARRIITGLYAICTRRRHPGDNESAKG